MLDRIDQNRYHLLETIIEHSGTLPDIGMKAANLEPLRDFGLVFPVIHHKQKILCMPAELRAVFSQCDGPELKRLMKRNTQWICLTHGMLHYYGVMGIRPLMEKVEP
ncbi:hypothetical protein GH808_05810 [Acetobacterium fimetarium]|uniref:Uncharacterized protein n=1 Tax=Acetobacterium fimetarium TaxID=52691 RepID=A0ABR6WTS4_9FIRM|nr:hypothetical protein [Acetobacterium fimetarium]MBC3803951.1 hypothetical protein [Acetobacterium fimetarium]